MAHKPSARYLLPDRGWRARAPRGTTRYHTLPAAACHCTAAPSLLPPLPAVHAVAPHLLPFPDRAGT